ncbi:MAG TPA: alpha/beta fold hydrolase [Verrucomicrobiae bacterium]|nr:alpha/beta fold hydrolase [Verrucomicrobiae bacterium]
MKTFGGRPEFARVSRFGLSLRAASLFALSLLFFAQVCLAQQSPAPRTVDLTAPDGTILKATFFAAAKPGPGVLLLHQCNRDRRAWDGLAQSLSAAGINVLTFDFRGFGESGGTSWKNLDAAAIDRIQTEKWPGDVDTAFQFLIAQPGVDAARLGAGGASCGVEEAVQLARRHPQVKSLVLLSEIAEPNGRAFLRSNPQMPMFLAVADDDPDRGVAELMEWMFTLSANPISHIERYPTGKHGVEMFEAHPELPVKIVEWWSGVLQSRPGATISIGALTTPQQSRLLDWMDRPGGAEKDAEILEQMQKLDPNAEWLPEGTVNRIGYEHLLAGDAKVAVEIFKLNVLAYPGSANVYDSLGDAYLVAGEKEMALASAKKALEMLATDTKDSDQVRKGIQQNAEFKVNKLTAPAK